MGNSPSNRRVTVVNDDVVGIVQVSESVVKRLRGESKESSDKQAKRNETEMPPEPDNMSKFVPYRPIEPYSSTLEQRQKYHEELKKAENSWQNRINELEFQNRQLFETSKNNFSASISEVEDNHMKNSYVPVCPDKQQKVLKCYKEHPKKPLNCSRDVEQFIQSVEQFRMTALSK